MGNPSSKGSPAIPEGQSEDYYVLNKCLQAVFKTNGQKAERSVKRRRLSKPQSETPAGKTLQELLKAANLVPPDTPEWSAYKGPAALIRSERAVFVIRLEGKKGLGVYTTEDLKFTQHLGTYTGLLLFVQCPAAVILGVLTIALVSQENTC